MVDGVDCGCNAKSSRPSPTITCQLAHRNCLHEVERSEERVYYLLFKSYTYKGKWALYFINLKGTVGPKMS